MEHIPATVQVSTIGVCPAGGNKYRDPHPDNVQTVRELGTFSSGWEVSIKSLPSGIRELRGRGGRKNVQARGDGGHQRNKAFQTQADQYTYELSETVVARSGGVSEQREEDVSPHLLLGNYFQLITTSPKKNFLVFSNAI